MLPFLFHAARARHMDRARYGRNLRPATHRRKYRTSPPSATTPAGASKGGAAETSGTSEAPQDVSEERLRGMHMDELRDMARDKGLSGVHDMRKEELIDAISGKRGS
ncbi:hypothetical protein CTU88_35380 [Streptomyces sp. JV178]|uniref:Rho termination factor N-terminal domain-containing protein n=1 Tax=Streptomyces sp. JV178 TaxID=858632 RepID=UPI000C1B5A21|nr:Rho termination factor N-terminal domain-containing protein [Streptomyces sp. JV178]PIM68010.1 hypothetical protein CTU88_35380 [Streptomyces sp. JV178]